MDTGEISLSQEEFNQYKEDLLSQQQDLHTITSKTINTDISQSRRGLNTDHIPSELMRKGVISQTMQVLLSGRQKMHQSILE